MSKLVKAANVPKIIHTQSRVFPPTGDLIMTWHDHYHGRQVEFKSVNQLTSIVESLSPSDYLHVVWTDESCESLVREVRR